MQDTDVKVRVKPHVLSKLKEISKKLRQPIGDTISDLIQLYQARDIDRDGNKTSFYIGHEDVDGIWGDFKVDFDDEKLDDMIDSGKIVIPFKNVAIQYNYPLHHPTSFDHVSPGKGFTRADIALLIRADYRRIYEEEGESFEIDPVPVHNRPESNGKYGIWGHHVKHLWVEKVIYEPCGEDRAIVSLEIGS